MAIEKLCANAEAYEVLSSIHGDIQSIEDFVIPEKSYDFIIAISALEHVAIEKDFKNKLVEIRDGICENGIVCLVVNSNVREAVKSTGKEVSAQFEVNLPTKKNHGKRLTIYIR